MGKYKIQKNINRKMLFLFFALNLYLINLFAQRNFIRNNSFNDGMESWKFYRSHHAWAKPYVLSNKGFYISIRNGGSEMQHLQLSQDGIPLINGCTYTMLFDARAEAPRSINAMMQKNSDPWTNYSNCLKFDLSTEMQTFKHTFTMNEPTDWSASICFEFGIQKIGVIIDNVMLIKHRRIGCGRNLIKNGNFNYEMYSWNFYCDDEAIAEWEVIKYNNFFSAFILYGGYKMWHVHLRQNNIPLIQGHTYIMRFDARSWFPRTIHAMMEEYGNDYTPYSEPIEFNLKNSLQTFEHRFIMSNPTDLASSICFKFGKYHIGVVNIDNVSLIEDSTGMLLISFHGSTGSIELEDDISKNLIIGLNKPLESGDDPVIVGFNVYGTATPDQDFSFYDNTITFYYGGSQEQLVNLDILDDPFIEEDAYEKVIIELQILSGRAVCYNNYTYTHVIIDDDDPSGPPPLRKPTDIADPYFGKPTILKVAAFGEESAHVDEARHFKDFFMLLVKNN